MSLNERQRRRLTRGTVELRRRVWWNRFREEIVDVETGVVSRHPARMRLGRFRSQIGADEALDRYLALLAFEELVPGIAVTAREYFARFDRLKVAMMKDESQRQFRWALRILDRFLGALALSAITANVLQELAADLHKRHFARASIGSVIDRAFQVLRDARAAGYACHEIARKSVKLPSDSRAAGEQRHFSPVELVRIIEASEFPRRALWATLGFTGLRIGEGLALTWADVDLRAGIVHVRRGCVRGTIAALKTKRSRRDVPILPQLHQELSAFRVVHAPNPLQLLFATVTGKPVRADDVRRALARLLRRLGMEPAGTHAFRHSLPLRLDALGMTPAAIQRWMGHAQLAITERYLHHDDEDLRGQLTRALAGESQNKR
jgi:integrase